MIAALLDTDTVIALLRGNSAVSRKARSRPAQSLGISSVSVDETVGMMLAVEHAIEDFQRDLDAGKITSLDMASSRVGRLVGESVVVQSAIYAMMKRPDATEVK